MPANPLIVGLGGTTRPESSSKKALHLAARAAERRGARVEILAGADLDLPMYAPERPERSEKATRLIELLRAADGIILSSPGYHGSISGLLKNALDYIEDLRDDARPYLHARSIGCIVSAYGWQATGTTLVAMRSIVHALQAWPTPLGVAINSAITRFDSDGNCSSEEVARNLDILGEQVVGFARMDWPTWEDLPLD